MAARRGYTGVVELLLRKGAPIEAMNGFGRTPLYHGAFYCCIDVTELLLRGAASIEAIDMFGYPLLHHAIMCEYTGMVQLLLGKGAPIEAIDQCGRTALHLILRGDIKATPWEQSCPTVHENGSGCLGKSVRNVHKNVIMISNELYLPK